MLRIVQPDAAPVIGIARHQEIQERGFSAAAAAHNRVRLPRFKLGGYAVQNLPAAVIAE